MLGKKGSRLNAYVLAEIIKKELQASADDAMAATLGKTVRKPPSKDKLSLKKKKKQAMVDLRDNGGTGEILRKYMIHMGSLSEKYDKRTKAEGLDVENNDGDSDIEFR